MKKYLLVLMFVFSGTALAQVYPRVSNFGNQVNVNIWNHTNRDVTCSGWIYITSFQGRTDSIHFFERVWRRGTLNRYYRPRNPMDRIRHVNHSIWCR